MTISEQIITVLDDLCRRFGLVIDWTKETIAPYLEELAGKLVAYEVATSYFWIYFMLALTGIAWILGVVFLNVGSGDDGFTCIIAACVTATMVIVVGCQIYDIITCEVLPEKILFRELKELLESAKNY